MIKMEYKNGLLFTTIELVFRGQVKEINNIVLDTGASVSIISPDSVGDIGIFAEAQDKIISSIGVGGIIHNSFEKKIDEIKFGNQTINDIKLDFGIIDPKGNINGLLGLDVLMNFKAIIDLNRLKIEFAKI